MLAKSTHIKKGGMSMMLLTLLLLLKATCAGLPTDPDKRRLASELQGVMQRFESEIDTISGIQASYQSGYASFVQEAKGKMRTISAIMSEGREILQQYQEKHPEEHQIAKVLTILDEKTSEIEDASQLNTPKYLNRALQDIVDKSQEAFADIKGKIRQIVTS